MANEERLIGAYTLAEEIESLNITVAGKPARWNDAKHSVLCIIAEQPDVDAVEASRLGNLGRLMMPYKGCPRGRMGARGDGRIIELDPIKDVEGDIWVPVLEEDLDFLKAKAVEVVHGRWTREHTVNRRMPMCSECWQRATSETNYCPNCGAKMDGDGNGCA